MRKRKDISGLIRMLSHPESEIRGVAALALGEFGDERAIEPLAKALRNEDHTARAIIEALEKFKNPKAIDALISALGKDAINASVARESLIRIGTVSEEPLIAVINRASTLKSVGHPSVLREKNLVPRYALGILEKIGDVSAIRPIINLARNNTSYSNSAVDSLKHILRRRIADISVEDLKLISTIHGIVGVIGEQPVRGDTDDDWLTEPIYGLLELKLQMPELRQIAMQELKRRNIEMIP